jgi:pyridoxine/pyridoxamine 5'-phosphate oxidase
MKLPKKFDCLAFKRSAQMEIYEEIKHLTREEQLTYFRSRAESGPLGAWWKLKLPVGHSTTAPSARVLGPESEETYEQSQNH